MKFELSENPSVHKTPAQVLCSFVSRNMSDAMATLFVAGFMALMVGVILQGRFVYAEGIAMAGGAHMVAALLMHFREAHRVNR